MENLKRVESIDLLRGIVMVIMALDHTRDLFHFAAFTGNPLDPDTSTVPLYFIRWVTHFCAPTFVFLSGMSAWFQGKRKSKKELGNFLITRGLWLILVDLVVMSLALTADINYGMLALETLWSIGISMAILGLLIRLPLKLILLIGLVIFFGHNLLDFAERDMKGNVPLWWNFLHVPKMIPLWKGHNLFIFYPFLSWTGLMLLGYCCGKIFTDMDQAARKKLLLGLGFGLIALFVILRYINVYGDPVPWVKRSIPQANFFAFMNFQKYPPSLLFLCATIGPGLIFLALVKEVRGRLGKMISVYGRVPLFYFVVHFFILHIASIIMFLVNGHTVKEGMEGAPGFPFKFIMPGEGVSLKTVYLIWIAVVIIMYPLCYWYDRYKQAHKEKKWLSYF